jgi:hypothetical protein
MIGFTIKFISTSNRGQATTLLFKASGTNACAVSSGTSTNNAPSQQFSVSGNCCVMIMLIPSVYSNTAYSYCWTVVSSI